MIYIAFILVLIGLVLFFLHRQTLGEVNPWQVNFRPFGIGVAALGAFFFMLAIFTVVSVGEVGIPVTFGSTSSPLSPGIHLVNPFASVHTMNLRTQQYTMAHQANEGNIAGDDSIGVLGKDGGTANVDATLLFHIDRNEASSLYKRVGTSYVNQILRPAARDCVRAGFTEFNIVDAATVDRKAAEIAVHDCIASKLQPYGLVVDDLQIRQVTVEGTIQTSVNSKISAQQGAAQKVFELQGAEQDARITTVKAKATADSQQILACGGKVVTVKDSTGKAVQTTIPNDKAHCDQAQLTPAFLSYSYIQALLAAANSPNHSTFVIPSDSKLTPILNTAS